MSPGPEDEVSQHEKARILREQASTYHQHAVAQAGELSGGRFGVATPAPTVTGSTPIVKVPQLPSSSPWSGAQPEPGPEPPLNYEINKLTPYELEPSMGSTRPVEDTGGAPSSAPPEDVAAPPPSSPIGDPAVVSFPSHPDTLIPSVDAGSPTTNQDDGNG
jgi:hypothetical protein